MDFVGLEEEIVNSRVIPGTRRMHRITDIVTPLIINFDQDIDDMEFGAFVG